MKSYKELYKANSLTEKNYAKLMLQGKANKRVLPMTIITAENPQCRKTSQRENRELNDKLEQYFRSGGYIYKKIRGYYGIGKAGVLPEHSFIVAGLTLDIAQWLAKQFEQQSFIYIDKIHDKDKPYKFYAVDKTTGKYVMTDAKRAYRLCSKLCRFL